MKRLQTFLTLLVLLMASVSFSWSATLYVGPAETYTTIQAAVTFASGGDIIEVKNGTYNENVNIPGGKNGLIIRAFTGDTPVLEGVAVSNPKVAFRINSDNVTIQGFTIQNYNYGGATNVSYGQATRGIGIESLIASSQHTFSNNTITNCNWGIYSREGNNISVANNTINNIVKTTAGTYPNEGGTAIAFISGGVAMDGNIIDNNTIDFNGISASYGIFFGRIGANTPADFVQIKNNDVIDGSSAGFFAYGIYGIKDGESVAFSNNTSDNCYYGLDIYSSTSTDNGDVVVTSNAFNNTVGSIEVRTNSTYSGSYLYDIFKNNNNTFDEGTPASTAGAIVALEENNDIVVVGIPATYRYIRNQFSAGVADAEAYINAITPINARVYVADGYFATLTPATITLTAPTDELAIIGESYSAQLVSPAAASVILDIISGTVEVDPITFNFDVSTNNQIGIRSVAPNTWVHDVHFTSNTLNYYTGIQVLDGALEAKINNNEFAGNMGYGIRIETTNLVGNQAIIECNLFNSSAVSNNRGIWVGDFDGGLEAINYIDIINNTFNGSIAHNIQVNLLVLSSDINIGTTGNGNIFNATSTNAIVLYQTADNQVTIKNNAFYSPSNYTAWIENNVAFDVIAGFNYWDVPSLTNAPVITVSEITGEFAGAGSANISFLPIYTDDTETLADQSVCGFQPQAIYLWTPVYTTDVAGNFIDNPANEFFLTIEDALADANTVTGDLQYVYLYLNYDNTLPTPDFIYAENNPLDLGQDIEVAAAPAQPANGNIEPFCRVDANNVGSTFRIATEAAANNNYLYGMIINSNGSAGTDYPIEVLDQTLDNLEVENCHFDVSSATGADAAIKIGDGVNTFTSTGVDILFDNIFAFDNGNIPVDFTPSIPASSASLGLIINSTFTWGGTVDGPSIQFCGANDYLIQENDFGNGLYFTTGNSGTGFIDVIGNTFNNTTQMNRAINFTLTGVPVAPYINNILIRQNLFDNIAIAIDFADGSISGAGIDNFTGVQIIENNFTNIGTDGIDAMVFGGSTSKIDATNNHWFSNYGPYAYEDAPLWHDDFGSTIISNAYGYLYNQSAGAAVPLQNATYIQYVPWWQDLAGAPLTYTGTPFTPIANDDGIPINDDYASLIFAVDGTDDLGNIYMENVPDWLSAGTVEYVESNTIANADKSLSIWGQPFWYPTTKISTTNNDPADIMFYFTGTAARTINLNYLEIVPDDAGGQDLFTGVYFDVNASGTIDWCYFNGLEGVNDILAVYLTDVTNTVAVNNSEFGNIDGGTNAWGIASSNASLSVDNTVFVGLAGTGNTSNSEIGIIIGSSSNLTLTNSTFSDYDGNSGIGAGTLAQNLTINPVGTIAIYQNIFNNNEVGLQFGLLASAMEDYSSAQIYNNIIKDNTTGLVYVPGVASTLTVENNYWGSDNGPISEAQVGGTQENTYNETAQGNAVVDQNANSTIDYIPWRRYFNDDLTTKIAGPKFAPIVRTNAANIAQALYANFTDAEAALIATQKIYAYAGTYSEDFTIDVNNTQLIGKLAPANYLAGWIIAPNAPQFSNAWTASAQGANAAAPKIIYGGGATTILTVDNNNISIKGFIFDAQAKTYPADPYTGDPILAINSALINNTVTIQNNTILADATDTGIDIGNGGDTDWYIGYNDFQGIAGTTFLDASSNVLIDGLTVEYNQTNGGRIYLSNGAGDFIDGTIQFNEFTNTNGAILLDGTVSAGNFENLQITNNKIASTNTYAFLISSTTPDGVVNTDWTTDVNFTNNFMDIAASAQIVVGFDNFLASTIYTSEITATCNWWGTVNGPTYLYNPGGNAGRVSDMAFFTPWLSGATNGAAFGFLPTDACNAGERVWVNSDANPATKTIIFPGLQMAVMHASVVNGTNDNIFVADSYNTTPNYVQEDISIDWNAISNTIWSETIATELVINGNFELAGVGNSYNLFLGSPLRVKNQLTLDNIGCQGWIYLDNNNLSVEGYITEGYFNTVPISCQVATNGIGYLIKENVITGGINNFPVIQDGGSSTGTPAQFVVNASGFVAGDNNKIKVRVVNDDPVTYKGMGEDGYDVNNIWDIDFENNNGANPNMAMQLFFLDNSLNDGSFNNITSYGAFWDEFPTSATQWTSRKSTSSWNGSDGVQITNLNLESGRTDWAIFSGPTSFALSDAVNQAKNIQWLGGDDNTLTFQWLRNDVNAQYYAIMGIEGSMTAAPALFTPSASCGATNGPWTCSATDRNFSDGYVDNVTGASWTAGLFHNGAATPADVKVLYVGTYTGATQNISIDNLKQGTYYSFFVANFNYGDGTTTIPNMITGADGMANYNLASNTLNPRVRKTQPAVYMTLDLTSTPYTPYVVYGTTPMPYTTLTDILDPSNHWRTNVSGLTGNTVVENQYNGDALTGGIFAEVCANLPYSATPSTIALYFKGYGNNGGTNWAIKYSENNSTYTFTTPLINSTTNRSRTVATKYYLVSAYDGDGKVAKLYDNNKDLQFIFDATSSVVSAVSGTMPTCEGNALTFTTATNSIPAATFVDWEVSKDNGATFVGLGSLPNGSIASTFTDNGIAGLNFTNLDYADNGYQFRARYSSNSVCDFPTLGDYKYTTPITLSIYDASLTGSTPLDVESCSNTTSVDFVSNDGAPLVSPNVLTFVQWEVNDNVNPWTAVAGVDYSVVTAAGTSTLTVNNLGGKDNYQYRAVWQNGDCATVPTGAATLDVVPQPNTLVINGPTPSTICAGNSVTLSATASDWTSVEWFQNGNATALTAGTPAWVQSITDVVGVSTTLILNNVPVGVDASTFYAVFTNAGTTVNCTNTTVNSGTLTVLPAPVFNAIADQTVCENTQLQVTAVDGNPVSWSGNVEWYYNSVPNMTGATQMTTGNSYNGSTVAFSGASDAIFTIATTDLSWNGVYVIAYNDNGTCDGFEAFQVTVDEAPIVATATVTAVEVCEGQPVTYTVTYTPAATSTVDWYYNNVLVVNGNSVAGAATDNVAAIITSAGTSTLVLSNVTLTIDMVNVYARVTNGVCNYAQSANLQADIESIPLAPSTIGAQNIFANRFDVTWTAIPNADDYTIEVDDDPLFGSLAYTSTIVAPNINDNGMGVCALLDAQTYYFRVRANNQCGSGPWTQSNLVTLDPTVVSIDWTSGTGVFGNQQVGTSSASNTYTITYYQLDHGLTVAVPVEFEIQTGASTWLSGNVDLTPYLTLYLGTPGTPLTLPVNVRFSPTTCGVNQVDFVHSSNELCSGSTNLMETEINAGTNDDASGTGVVASPTLNASNIIIMENTPNIFTTTWTDGGGTDRLVILSTNSTLSWTPTPNTGYTTPSSDITTATVLATDTWLVGVTPSQPLAITGLTAGVNYYLHIWEYNACGANTEQYDANSEMGLPYYLAFTSDEVTPVIPDQVSGVSSTLSDGTTPLNVVVNLTERDGSSIVAPANISVTVAQNPNTGTFALSPSSVTITGGNSLSNDFNFTWTESCGIDNGYLAATATNINGTQTNTFDLNVTAPTQQSRIVIWVGIPCASSTTFKWTNGNGAGRLVVVRKGSLPVAPSDFQTYTVNADWSAKSASNLIGSDSYAMGEALGTNNDITITNLEIGETFYFRVYEFNGCPVVLRKYNVYNATFNPRSRTISCKEGNNLYDIVLDRFNVTSNKGTGLINFNTLYEANISGFELRRIDLDDASTTATLVGSYMSNNELTAAGNTTTGKAYSFNDKSMTLEVGRTYLYQLTAVAFDGTRIDVAEAEITITDDIYTGISEFSVSPVNVNNNEANFMVTVGESQNVTIDLFDVTGQKISTIANDVKLTRGTHEFKTLVSNLTNGTYIIVVNANETAAVQKFQIVR